MKLKEYFNYTSHRFIFYDGIVDIPIGVGTIRNIIINSFFTPNTFNNWVYNDNYKILKFNKNFFNSMFEIVT